MRGKEICDIKDICHDQQQMMKKYDKIHFSKQRGQTALDWMMKILKQYHGYVIQQLNKSLSKSLMKTMSEVQMIAKKIQLPMIVSVLIMGDNGLVPINHVL